MKRPLSGALPTFCLIVPLAGLMACSSNEGATPVNARTRREPRAVVTSPVQHRVMQRTIHVSGSLAAKEHSTLSAKVPGRLLQLPVDLGTTLRAGDLIAQIDPRDYELRCEQALAARAQARAALGLALEGDDEVEDLDQTPSVRQAQAVFEEARKNRERNQELAKSKIVTDLELDSSEAAYAVARSRLETARDEARRRVAALQQRSVEYEISRKQLADTVVRAAFDGVVQSRRASPGEYVSAGVPIVTLVQIDPLRLRLEVSERDSGLVQVGQSVELQVEGDEDRYHGTITRIAPALDQDSRVLRVEADVPARGRLRPGRFVRAQILVRDDDEGLSVPPAAIVTFAGIEKVVRMVEGLAREQIVATGRRTAEWVEIRSGIEAGDIVVLDPAGVQTGDPLTALEPEPDPVDAGMAGG